MCVSPVSIVLVRLENNFKVDGKGMGCRDYRQQAPLTLLHTGTHLDLA